MSIENRTDIKVVWKPIPNSSQALAVDTRCNETLLVGSRGGGKTEGQLGAYFKYVGMGYGASWRGIIFDQATKSLQDIIAKSHKMFGSIEGAKYNIVDKKWTFRGGETLQFAILRLDEDYWDYHGQEFAFIGFNELTKYPTPYLYDAIQSCNRTGFLPIEHPQIDDKGFRYYLPPIPLMVVSTTNPHGAGHNWVKKRFIDVAPYGQVIKKTTKLYNPQTRQNELVERTQVSIFSSFLENPYLSKEYIANLMNYPDPNVRKAWVLGSWDIVSGGAFGDVWDSAVHVISKFRIPKGWRIDRTFDWGSSHPFSVGWWAEANGEEADVLLKNGEWIKFSPPKGSLIQFYEYYGGDEIGTNKGLQLPATDIAKTIREIEDMLVQTGWISTYPQAGSADNQIWNDVNKDNPCIADLMATEKVKWLKSDKSSGSRINGLQIMRQLLINAKRKSELPHIYFTDNCIASISTIPVLPRDEKNLDDVDTKAEDHCWDMTRYRVLNSFKSLEKLIEVKY